MAAAISAITDQTSVLSTSHVPTVHPILAAKQATTIDHVSDGRFTLNIVCGWFQPELEMFGAKIMEHDERYVYASEWLHVLRLLWTSEEEFDFEGKYFRIQKGFHQPKPIQRPFDTVKSRVDALRRLAHDEFNRSVQVWNSSYVVCRPTEKRRRTISIIMSRRRGTGKQSRISFEFLVCNPYRNGRI